jgi:hypothetical protein
MVTSSRFSGSRSSAARRFSPILPFAAGAAAITPSRCWYSASHLAAVFGPPSTPGTLSTVSPISASRSMIWSAHAELLHHRRIRIHAAAGHGVDQLDARAHQLGEVLVAGGNGHLQVLRQALKGQRADHIVGFHAGDAQDADAQRFDDAAHRLDLAAQLIGHRRAVGLALVVQVVTEGLAGRVDHERDVGRALLQRRTQHVDHAEQRAGGFTLCIGQGRQRVERAVQVTGPVDQDSSAHVPILRARACTAAAWPVHRDGA